MALGLQPADVLLPIPRVLAVHQPHQRVEFRVRIPAVTIAAGSGEEAVTELRTSFADFAWRDDQLSARCLRGELDLARQRLEKAVDLAPDAPTVHYQLGLLYRRLGQTEKAKEHLGKSKQP